MNKLKHNLFVFLVLGFIVFLIYYRILDHNFLSDDYDSLYRICIEHTIIVKEFFRPIIDISFKFNYFFSGLNGLGYYILNLLVHIANAFLVYKIMNAYTPASNKYNLLGWLSAFLFIIYPFHNEAIVWLTGRLSSIACFFALLCIYVWLGNLRLFVKILLSIGFYFSGLLAYESILLLPLIILIFIWDKPYSTKYVFLFSGISLIVVIGYLLIRYYVSGNIYGGYGSRMTDVGFLGGIVKGGKTFGRLFLPPSENSNYFVAAAAILGIIMFFLNLGLFRIYSIRILTPYIKLVLVLITSLSIPVLFGISTRTGESDRLLYFPSVFICMIFAVIIQLLIKSTKWRLISCSVLSIYFVTFLLLNNKNWEKASELSGKILEQAKASAYRNIVYINLPDEIEGAFVFRNGFNKAMILNNIDTGKIWVNNMLTRLEYLEFKEAIHPLTEAGAVILPPVTKVSFIGNDSMQVENILNFEKRVFPKENTTILYWNTVDMIRLF
ncbi:MAG: hypothetical protein BGP13_16545 [Sphingobacteriales bacterium 40-81]|nr:MAG: hypothetical protein BGP13_16545 [Sphingobacteriales bacterium 40-81]